MSVSVPFDLLAAQVRAHGSVAYVVSVGDDGRPHTVSALVEAADDELRATVGRTTAANAIARPDVTLLWPPGPDPRYCLVVDARATVHPSADAGGELTLEPTRAVQHRLADAPSDVPSCIPIEAAS